MSTGRATVLDAAIELLGTDGIRGLTHRAVDAQAGLPTGATSNYFRTKDALYAGIVERFSARERAHWEELALRARPLTPEGLARTLSDFARDSVGIHRSLTLARYALLVEGALRPDLRSELAETGARVNAWFAQWLHAAGSTNAERDTQVVGNYLTGLVLHELARPSADFDPSEPLTSLIEMLVASSDPEAS